MFILFLLIKYCMYSSLLMFLEATWAFFCLSYSLVVFFPILTSVSLVSTFLLAGFSLLLLILWVAFSLLLFSYFYKLLSNLYEICYFYFDERVLFIFLDIVLWFFWLLVFCKLLGFYFFVLSIFGSLGLLEANTRFVFGLSLLCDLSMILLIYLLIYCLVMFTVEFLPFLVYLAYTFLTFLMVGLGLDVFSTISVLILLTESLTRKYF